MLPSPRGCKARSIGVSVAFRTRLRQRKVCPSMLQMQICSLISVSFVFQAAFLNTWSGFRECVLKLTADLVCDAPCFRVPHSSYVGMWRNAIDSFSSCFTSVLRTFRLGALWVEKLQILRGKTVRKNLWGAGGGRRRLSPFTPARRKESKSSYVRCFGLSPVLDPADVKKRGRSKKPEAQSYGTANTCVTLLTNSQLLFFCSKHSVFLKVTFEKWPYPPFSVGSARSLLAGSPEGGVGSGLQQRGHSRIHPFRFNVNFRFSQWKVEESLSRCQARDLVLRSEMERKYLCRSMNT